MKHFVNKEDPYEVDEKFRTFEVQEPLDKIPLIEFVGNNVAINLPQFPENNFLKLIKHIKPNSIALFDSYFKYFQGKQKFFEYVSGCAGIQISSGNISI